ISPGARPYATINPAPVLKETIRARRSENCLRVSLSCFTQREYTFTLSSGIGGLVNSKTRRFIVVDDSESTAQLLKSALRAVGPCTIDDARNGQIAYDKIVAASEEGKPYDLVLCDIN